MILPRKGGFIAECPTKPPVVCCEEVYCLNKLLLVLCWNNDIRIGDRTDLTCSRMRNRSLFGSELGVLGLGLPGQRRWRSMGQRRRCGRDVSTNLTSTVEVARKAQSHTDSSLFTSPVAATLSGPFSSAAASCRLPVGFQWNSSSG